MVQVSSSKILICYAIMLYYQYMKANSKFSYLKSAP